MEEHVNSTYFFIFSVISCNRSAIVNNFCNTDHKKIKDKSVKNISQNIRVKHDFFQNTIADPTIVGKSIEIIVFHVISVAADFKAKKATKLFLWFLFSLK